MNKIRYSLLAFFFLALTGCGKMVSRLLILPPEAVIDQLSWQVPVDAAMTAFGQVQEFSSTGRYKVTIKPLVSKTLERFSLLELDLGTDLKLSNPYDPGEIGLQVRFTAPSGKVLDVGAFWYQDFDPTSRKATGEPVWKVRFTPREVGTWEARAHSSDNSIQSEVVYFQVIESTRPGFVRLNSSNPHYLAFDNGDFFFPIGLNMAWCRQCQDPLSQYKQWLDLFSANGGNTIRVWMAAWSFGIEWKDTGLGNYDLRQYQAWLLDQVFKLAEELDVKVILVLTNHGPFSLTANSEWKDNPYNSVRGGPLTSPEQFVTNPEAKTYFLRRLYYIVNRWGYSPDLLAWEWFNEVDLTPISDEALIPWIQEMTTYLHRWDVNQHLTTNSFSSRPGYPVWQLPELDIVQRHEYITPFMQGETDLAGRAVRDFQTMAQSLPEKPILLGEFGYSMFDYGDDIEKSGIHLHNGLWATAFSGYAGTGMYWWWDNYIAPNNLWKHFKSLSVFLEGVDLAHYRPFTPLILPAAGGTSTPVDGLGLRGEDILLWVRSDGYTTQAAIATAEENNSSALYIPPQVKGLYLVVDGMDDGEYDVSWYNPQSSQWIGTNNVYVRNSNLTIPILPFQCDLAVKITSHK